MINYTKNLAKNNNVRSAPLSPGMQEHVAEHREKLRNTCTKKYTICILYNQILRTYSQPLKIDSMNRNCMIFSSICMPNPPQRIQSPSCPPPIKCQHCDSAIRYPPRLVVAMPPMQPFE